LNILEQSYQVPFASNMIHTKKWHTDAVDHALAPIILMHDSLGCVALWRDFPARLAQATARVVYAYDRLGFGLSDASTQPLAHSFVITEAEQAFKAVLDYFSIQNFVILGHSVGGGMAVAIAAAYPVHCQGLISISAQYAVEALTLKGISEAKIGFQQAGQMERLERYHPEKAQWVLDAWTETWLSPAFQDWNLARVIDGVCCPTLIIHGELDEYGSTGQPQQIFEGVSGQAELHILEGLHHMPHKEQPELVVALIAEFHQVHC